MSAFFNLPPDERFRLARRDVGANVELEIDRLRSGDSFLVEGVLLSIAISLPSDVVVVRPDSGPDRAFSTAQIRAIRPRKWDR